MVMGSEEVLVDSVEDSRVDLMRGISVISSLHSSVGGWVVEVAGLALGLISVRISRCDSGSLSRMLYSV